MSLVGKFFFYGGKKFLQCGEVVDQIAPDLVLLRLDKEPTSMVPANSSIAVKISSFASKIDADGVRENEWEFFDSREELDKFLEWLDAPPADAEAPERHTKLN